jgi:hypothetical protein
MKFTKAEISEDGKMIRATLSPEAHDGSGTPPESYYITWDGAGKLRSEDAHFIDAVRARFPE